MFILLYFGKICNCFKVKYVIYGTQYNPITIRDNNNNIEMGIKILSSHLCMFITFF